jgi:hypothetical protein
MRSKRMAVKLALSLLSLVATGVSKAASGPPMCPPGWTGSPPNCFEIPQAAAAPPKQCPPGWAPQLNVDGWTCSPGYWPTVENQVGAAPLKLDCATGTSRIPIGPIDFGDSACLPPKPRCALGFQADPNPSLPAGWNCLLPPDCPAGTRVQLTPAQGYNCAPLKRSAPPQCPPHTAWGNWGAGTEGGCFPSDPKTCAQLRGWQWYERTPNTSPMAPLCAPPANAREAL